MRVSGKTPFVAVIGDMDVMPFIGQSLSLSKFFFNLGFPILLILITVFNFFDIYDKILNAMGLS